MGMGARATSDRRSGVIIVEIQDTWEMYAILPVPNGVLTMSNRNATRLLIPMTYLPSLRLSARIISCLGHSTTRHPIPFVSVVGHESCRMRKTDPNYKTTGGWMHPYMSENKGKTKIRRG